MQEHVVRFEPVPPSKTGSWIVRVDEDFSNSVMLRRSLFDFMQFAFPGSAMAIVLPPGTDVYELTPRQIRKMYAVMCAAGVKDDERIPVDVAREGAEQCPVCRGAGVITVVHPANDVPPTDGC